MRQTKDNMKFFNSYREFLESEYKRWIPDYEETHDEAPSEEILNRKCIFMCYTDYGGTFHERVAVAFLEENCVDYLILSQETIHYGKNLLYFLPEKFDSKNFNNEYTFPEFGNDFESFYYGYMEECFKQFVGFYVEDLFRYRVRLKKWAEEEILQHFSADSYSYGPDGQPNVCTSVFSDFLKTHRRK